MIRQSLLALTAVFAMSMVATPASARSHVRKVSRTAVSDYWVRTNDYVEADVPNSGQGLDKVGCAAVSYMIGSDGQTRHVKVQKVVPPTSDFDVIAASMVDAFHYRLAPQNTGGVPVRTYFIVPFNVPAGDDATMQRMLEACHLPGYGN